LHQKVPISFPLDQSYENHPPEPSEILHNLIFQYRKIVNLYLCHFLIFVDFIVAQKNTAITGFGVISPAFNHPDLPHG